MNLIRNSFGVTAFIVSAFFVAMYTQLGGGPDIPAKFVESFTDKLFYGLLMLGAASLSTLFGVMLVAKVDLMKDKPKMLLVTFSVASLSFLGGVYYHFVFMSPL